MGGAPAASPTGCRWGANSKTWTAGRCRMRSGRAARCLEGRDWGFGIRESGFGNRDLERRGYHPQSPIPNPQSPIPNPGYSMTTIFHKIIRREIPADIVYEDDDIIPFRDIAPPAPVPVLFVPQTDRIGRAHV